MDRVTKALRIDDAKCNKPVSLVIFDRFRDLKKFISI
jgi:hypothetical protein